MSKAILFLFGLSLVATLGIIDAADESGDRGDHLVPVHNLQEVGSLAAYRTCWQTKLLVTPGDVARSIWLPGLFGEETAISVYRVRSATGSRRYAVTGTYASRRLWSYFSPGPHLPRGRPEDVPVKRVDAEMPEATAVAVRALWIVALQEAKKPPATNVIYIDSSTQIYSAVDQHGRLLIAKGPDETGPNTRRLFNLTGSLMEYTRTKPARQAAFAQKIRQEADDLRRAFANPSKGQVRRNVQEQRKGSGKSK